MQRSNSVSLHKVPSQAYKISLTPSVPGAVQSTSARNLPPVKKTQKPKGILGAILSNDIEMLKDVLEKEGTRDLNIKDSEGWFEVFLVD